MPQDTLIIVGAVTVAFLIFASVLYWAERRTRNLSH
jgi:hypothetical protein